MAIAGVAASALTSASSAAADSPSARRNSFTWDPAWSDADTWDYSFTGVAALDVAFYVPLLQSKEPPLQWTRPILFDTAVRNLLRGSPSVRGVAASSSWALLGLVVAYPFLDVPVEWGRDGGNVAWNLFWEDATAMSIATAVDLNLRDLVGRARPPVAECLIAGGSRSQCLGDDAEATRSFPGGHQLIVTSAASLTCTQHLEMHLYGGAWDGVACGAATTLAFTVGVLRIVADDHWASDILTGDVLGVAFGWGIPTLMHLHGEAPVVRIDALRMSPLLVPVPGGAGAGVTGIF